VPVLAWGQFFTIAVNFLILAFVIFLMVRAINRLRRQHAELRQELHRLAGGPARTRAGARGPRARAQSAPRKGAPGAATSTAGRFQAMRRSCGR